MSDIEDITTIQAQPKPKRKYVRKTKPHHDDIVVDESIPELKPSELGRSQGDKKPRTEKQKEALQRMLQAKKDKHNELLDLRDIEKGQAKIDQIEEKIVAKKKKVMSSASGRTRVADKEMRSDPLQPQPSPASIPTQQTHQSVRQPCSDDYPIRQVSTTRPIVFM